MKLSKEQYNELVEKLADELVLETMEKTAKENTLADFVIGDRDLSSPDNHKTKFWKDRIGGSLPGVVGGNAVRNLAESAMGSAPTATVLGIGAMTGINYLRGKNLAEANDIEGPSVGRLVGSAALAPFVSMDSGVKRQLRARDEEKLKKIHSETKSKTASDIINQSFMLKEAAPRDEYGEYDNTSDTLKRIGKWTGGGALIGSGVGVAMEKSHHKAGGALAGAMLGSAAGMYGGSVHQAIRDSKSAKKQFEGDKRAVRDAQLLGPMYAEMMKKKREFKANAADGQNIKEAAQHLLEAIMYKTAAHDQMEESQIVAEASEIALNSIGYSMFSE